MDFKASLWSSERGLPVILLAAVVQGWLLYGLHDSIVDSRWPSDHPPTLLALYAIALFVPLTLQFLAQRVRQRATWIILACLAVAVGYFGWHTGAIVDRRTQHFLSTGEYIPLACALSVLWLIALPFTQARLSEGRWRARYELLFSTAWTNKLALAEALLFTGLFWLLLFLWQKLFDLLGIRFFEELFEEPMFVYPVTSIVFGIALHLIGSIDRLTSIVLEHLLSVLKWLALIAGLILTLFTIALVMKLPGMLESGERIIGAGWLLWLVAVTVLLVNAAYRDGSVERPYPRPIALALRFVIPLIVIIALTAVYALYLRIREYGFTVERVWACIVAAAAVFYSIGYAFAAKPASPWMGSIARVNVAVALFLIAAISLALTPVLSPHRIAANSQYELALARQSSDWRQYGTPMHYLRYNAGEYGRRKLEELAAIEDHPRAAALRADAKAILEQHSWSAPLPSNVDSRLADMIVHPAGRELGTELAAQLKNDMQDPSSAWLYSTTWGSLIGTFIDLDNDGAEEFVVVSNRSAVAYKLTGNEWQRAGHFVTDGLPRKDDLLVTLREKGIVAEAPSLQNFRIGPHLFRFSPQRY